MAKRKRVEKPVILFFCAFCSLPQTEVRMMIAGPYVNICDGCVHVCQELIEGTTAPASAEPEVAVS